VSAKELPTRPSLEQYRKQAKDLLAAVKAGDPDARRRFDAVVPLRKQAEPSLTDAQLVLAREHGYESWPKFAKAIDAAAPASPDPERERAAARRAAERAAIAGDADALKRLLRDHRELLANAPAPYHSSDANPDLAAAAKAIVADEQAFASWDAWVAHIAAMYDGRSPVARFEAAVEAVLAGDVRALGSLLREDPELIRRRSTRTHRAMLLHYVGANGVEGFRQKTPKNAVQVAELLLDAGAEIDALADMYGGSATLGLIATSVHPKVAGVQDDLIELFLARGAKIDRGFGDDNVGGYNDGAVVGCLANGRGDAAVHLANRGGRLTLEGAAGVGRLDLVRELVRDDGTLVPPATQRQLRRGFNWACEYGRPAVVEYLVQRAVDVRHPRKGEAGLHWAAYGGHPDIVAILLRRGAPVNALEDRHRNTPLGWALYGSAHPPEGCVPDGHYQVVAQLVAAGATVQPHQLEAEHVRNDPWMIAALGGASRSSGAS
jgi:ankyrin repeat protein